MIQLDWIALCRRASLIESALAGRGTSAELVDAVLRILLTLPDPQPAPPPSPPPAAGTTPEKKSGPKLKVNAKAALDESAFGPAVRRALRERNMTYREFGEKSGLKGNA